MLTNHKGKKVLKELQLNCEQEKSRIVTFLRDQMATAGFSRAVLGLSGGVDSSLVAALSVEALGRENVTGLILPYKTSTPQSSAHAELVARQLGIQTERIDITPMVDAFIATAADMDATRRGNIMSRCRMILLYDRSAALQALVMGTSNRTESLLGYFTLYGDGAAAIKPIAHLYKCQVRELAGHLGIPEQIITKAPSADLWQGQTDEGELGFSYDEADQILYLLTEKQLGEEQVSALGFRPEVVKAVWRRMERTEFKRRWPPELTPGWTFHNTH